MTVELCKYYKFLLRKLLYRLRRTVHLVNQRVNLGKKLQGFPSYGTHTLIRKPVVLFGYIIIYILYLPQYI